MFSNAFGINLLAEFIKTEHTVNLTFNGINNSLCEKTGRIFSLCGEHLIAMFANTPVAKEFRKWCLDILDKEVGVPEHQPQSPEVFNGNDLNNLA
ncbi:MULTISPECIES: hypothetical protein [Candidatus Hamiltonella]|uniref:hypothetical protein n=1 Tax=Candidatus Williamhamiltonella TaxID=568987 RepID=UPI000C1DCCAA|nr:hypothetical protein [Candidatus Hamiltonella defensa]